LSRLHALFRADTRDEGTSGKRRLSIGERLDRARTGPADVSDFEPKIKDREAIKVFMVTWNMGDALVCANMQEWIKLIFSRKVT
jgi:hypothetical protein